MERENSDMKVRMNLEHQEDYFDEEEYSPWNKKKRRLKPNVLKMPEEISLLWLGIGFFVLIILLILFFPRNRNTIDKKQIIAIETRIKKLEEMALEFETIDDRVTQIWEQAKAFEQFKDRFDRSEASLSLRMDHLVQSIDNLYKKTDRARPRQAKPSGSEKGSKKTAKERYHKVSTGETLYSISRKYGLTVEKLQLLNKLAKGVDIRPGQKLLVTP
jgi:hypothetical protein